MGFKLIPEDSAKFVTQKMKSWAGYCSEENRAHEADDFSPTDASGYEPWKCAHCRYQISATKHMFLRDLQEIREKIEDNSQNGDTSE